ncbi:MAG: hypothetical protein V1859_05790 [archaeon]
MLGKSPQVQPSGPPAGGLTPAPKPQNFDAASQKIAGDINEIMRRLRILEERYSNLRKKNQLTDQNMIDDTKKLSDDFRLVNSTINDLKKEIIELNTKIRMLTEEMQQTVDKGEVALLSKYIDLWDPMSFVRRSEAEKMIRDIVEEIKKKPKGI